MILLFAALLFAFGFLLGTVAHNHAFHREYQRIAKRVRELREIQDDLTTQQGSMISQFREFYKPQASR
jgi:hypothetical protein